MVRVSSIKVQEAFLLDWSESPGSIILDFSRNNGGGDRKRIIY